MSLDKPPQESGLEPLKRPPYTMFHNYVLDTIMRELSPNAWKVLCWAMRKTIGWADDSTVSGRKESDVISYSQFMEGTGIGGRSTLAAALEQCLEKGYLKRTQAGTAHGKPIFSYHLNTEYKVQNQDSPTTPLVLFQDSQKSQNRTNNSPKTGHTKETETKNKEADVVGSLLAFGVDQDVAEELAPKCTLKQVEDWIAYITGPHGRKIKDGVAFLVSRLRKGLYASGGNGKQVKSTNRRRFIEGEYADYIEH